MHAGRGLAVDRRVGPLGGRPSHPRYTGWETWTPRPGPPWRWKPCFGNASGRDRRRCEVGGLAVGRRAASGRTGAGVLFVTPRCRAALPRRVRSPRRLPPPPVLSLCVSQPGGGDRRRGQDRWRGRGDRQSSDKRPERARVVMPLCLAASARRAVCPLFVFVCVPAEETSTAGRSAGDVADLARQGTPRHSGVRCVDPYRTRRRLLQQRADARR